MNRTLPPPPDPRAAAPASTRAVGIRAARLRLLLCSVAPWPILLGALVAPAGAQLRAGAARADLTPPPGGAMYGYGARQDVSTGVHDRIWARALVLEHGPTRVAIVALDLGSISKLSTENVRALVAEREPFDQVLLAASHTHSAPRAAEDFPSPERPHVREVERRIADAVVEAARTLQPVILRAGRGELAGCHNRRLVLPDGSVEMLWENRAGRPTTPLERSVGVIAVDGEAGPLATLVRFTCHPVVLGPENLEISADYPGALAQRLEQATGGLALFLPGAAGDTNPNWDKTPPAEGGFEQADLLGRRLADEVLRVRAGLEEAADPVEPALAVEVARVELAPRWDLDDPGLRQVFVERDQERLFDYYRERFAAERVAEVSTLRLGPSLALAFFPGEFFVEHGLRLERQSLFEQTFFVGYTNGELGYFPTIRAAAEGGYGADEATLVEVGAGERLVDLALISLARLAGRLTGPPGS